MHSCHRTVALGKTIRNRETLAAQKIRPWVKSGKSDSSMVAPMKRANDMEPLALGMVMYFFPL